MAIAAVTGGATITSTWGNSVADALNNVKAAEVATSETTASTTYADPATPGPAVTCETGTSALVLLSARANNSVTGNSCFMGVDVSGDSTIAASDAKAIWHYDAATANSDHMSGAVLVTGLTPGTNTFTAKYRTNSGTGTFAYRVLAVIPLQ